MNVQNISQNIGESVKKHRKIAIGVICVIVALLIFRAGVSVGYHKAFYSYSAGDRFYRTFEGNAGPVTFSVSRLSNESGAPGMVSARAMVAPGAAVAPTMAPMAKAGVVTGTISLQAARGDAASNVMFYRDDLSASHGVSGRVVSLSLPTFIVAAPNNLEKTVVVSDKTIIRKFRDTVTQNDIQPDDFVVVLGEPEPTGEIEARFVRIAPESFTAATSASAPSAR